MSFELESDYARTDLLGTSYRSSFLWPQ